MVIKSFSQFVNEEISGTELVGPMGPAYGETRLQNKNIYSHHTNVIEGVDGVIYTQDDWTNLYGEYLKSGGSPLFGFNKENLDTVINFLGN